MIKNNCDSNDTDYDQDENNGEQNQFSNGITETIASGNENSGRNSIDANDDDSGGSSLVADADADADDEPHSNSFNSSIEENRGDFENNINDQAANWELFINENLAIINPNEEKIYEDLCYVTFSTNLPEVFWI